MTITQAMLDVCQEALYLLRQDVSLPTLATASTDTGMEWVKCRMAFDYAATEVLSAHDWRFARGSETAKASVDGWPENVRKVLVYCLARELAVQIAGRTEDLKNWNALYDKMLLDARLKDLAEDESGDELVREVSALFRDFALGDAQQLPRSMASIHARILAMKRLAMREVLSAHPWGFAAEELEVASAKAPGRARGEYVNALPVPDDCLKVREVYGTDGEILRWEIVSGEIRANGAIGRIVYTREVEELAAFSADAYRLVVLRLAADMARVLAVRSSLTNLHENIYRDALKEAKTRDTRQSRPSASSVWGPNHYAEVMGGRR